MGTEGFRRNIQSARLNMFGYNVKNALEMIEYAYNKIIHRGETYDSLYYHVFDCLKSAKNTNFVMWAKRAEQDILSGTGEYKEYTAQMLIKAAKKQYLTVESRGDWNKVDPWDAQMMALVMQLNAAKTAQPPAHTPERRTGGRINSYEDWQLVKDGDTKTMKGTTWWWCQKHNDDKGLYVHHPLEDHEKWPHAKKDRKDPLSRYTPPPTGFKPTAPHAAGKDL